ncbi:hypothetical protein CKO09_12220 [Chromatium weissei]|nr:hypothetical protein [Chromatium weissei]
MIEIEYIVKDHHGIERLRTQDKKTADAFDRSLEHAERLAQWLRTAGIAQELSETGMEELTFYLVRNAATVERILKGKPLELTATTDTVTE